MSRWIFRLVLSQLLGLGCLLYAHTAHAHELVELLLQEALPNDPKASQFKLLQGITRTQEPVSFGIPFPPDTNFFGTDKMTLFLKGQVYANAQFHIEQRWSDRRVKWLRVHMQFSLKPNQQEKELILKPSQVGEPAKGKLLEEKGEQYIIDTGKAKFWINKTRFGLFEKVEVDGKQHLADTPQPGLLLKDTKGMVYEAARDTKVSYQVEDNGPFYVALVAKGKHVSKDGKDLLDFTLRMHFYKGKKRVRLSYTLRNASKRRLENVRFQSAGLQLKAAWDKPSYLVRHHDGEAKGDLAESGKLRLFQGENAFPTIRGKGFEEKYWPTGIKGYKLTLDGKDLKQGDREQYISLFYAQARHSDGRAIMAGTRFAAGHWPQGLGLDGDGTVHIGLFPEGNDKPYTIRFGSHITRECVLFFEAKAEASPRDEFFRFQYPVIAKPLTVETFNAEGMFVWRLISFFDEGKFSKNRKWPFDKEPTSTAQRRPKFAIVRHVDRSADQPANQFSPGLIAGFNFFREGALYGGVYQLMAEAWMRYNADNAVFQSDDFDASKLKDEVPDLVAADGTRKPFTALPGADGLPPSSPLWTPKNQHAHGLAFWARTAANRRQFRAYFDWGETLPLVKKDLDPILGNPRALGWQLFHLADYTFNTGLKEANITLAALLNSMRKGTPKAPRDAGAFHPTRGYYMTNAQTKESAPTLETYTQASVLSWAFAIVANDKGQSQEARDSALDLLEAVAYFTADELWYQGGDAVGDQGLAATYKPATPRGDLRKAKDWNKGLQDAYSALYYGYILTCDKAFLTKGLALLKTTAFNPGKISWILDRPGRHMMQDLFNKRATFP